MWRTSPLGSRDSARSGSKSLGGGTERTTLARIFNERLVLFNNERGKGDHRHIRDVESAYAFESIERLTEDFMMAVRTIQEEDGQ
jgi:hypothetical protein